MVFKHFICISFLFFTTILNLYGQDELTGTIVLSNGKIIKGDIEIDYPGIFSLYIPSSKRRIRLKPQKVARILFSVEKEELLQGWMFQEESRNTKIKLPFFRPIRQLRATIILKTGQRLVGHLDPCVLHVFEIVGEEEEEHKIILTTNQRGKKGQKLEDLVWVKEIVLGKSKPLTKLSKIIFQYDGDALFRAVSLEHIVSYGPKKSKKNNEFTIPGVLPGKVYLFAKKGENIYLGWPKHIKPIQKEKLKYLIYKVQDVEEYFDEKKVLIAGYIDKNKAIAIVQGRRKGITTFSNRKQARWDLYIFNEIEENKWEIVNRLFLFRVSGKVKGKIIPGIKNIIKREDFVVNVPDDGRDIKLGEVEL